MMSRRGLGKQQGCVAAKRANPSRVENGCRCPRRGSVQPVGEATFTGSLDETGKGLPLRGAAVCVFADAVACAVWLNNAIAGLVRFPSHKLQKLHYTQPGDGRLGLVG